MDLKRPRNGAFQIRVPFPAGGRMNMFDEQGKIARGAAGFARPQVLE
jgi:hypothetical protein